MSEPIISTMYNGAVEVKFSEAAHRYWVREKGQDNWVSISGVTTILSKVVPKNLVQWAADQAVGVLLPHVGESLTPEMLEEARAAHRVVKEEAATIGKQVHAWVEEFVKSKGESRELPNDERVLNGVTAFLKWWNETGAEIIESERIVFHPGFHYIGTMDAYVKIGDKYFVADWKTSNGLWPEHLLQVAAYASAFRMETGRPIDGIIIARFGKDTGEFEEKVVENTTPIELAFERAVAFSRDLETMKKLMGK